MPQRIDRIEPNKQELGELPIKELIECVRQGAWIALKQYFDGAGNGPEAKIACVVVTVLARERQLQLLQKRLLLPVSD